MPRPDNYGRFPGRRGRPSKAAVQAMKEAEQAAEAERKAKLPVYPMLTYPELREKFNADIRSVDPSEVTDINDIHIPKTIFPYKWLQAWITQTGNPFLFKIDGTVVQLGGSLDPPVLRRIPKTHGAE